MKKIPKRVWKVCPQCGFNFIPKTTSSLCCSLRCSKLAYKSRKKKEREEQRLRKISKNKQEQRLYIPISEAISLFAITRSNLYSRIRMKKIRAVRVSEGLLRVNVNDIRERYPLRKDMLLIPKRKEKILYSLEPEDCYTIGEISKKYKIGETSVYTHIRKYSIPTRQIGRFVYVPKSEIDKLYKPKTTER